MGYNNNYNRNNNYRYNKNNGYNRNYNNNYRPQNNRPENIGFDATVYKKQDIPIKDLNGKIYHISGNFSTAFSADIIKTFEQAQKLTDKEKAVDNFPEIFSLLKNWCLSLISLNTDGYACTMADVEAGFNDIHVLQGLVNYIANLIALNPQDNKANGNSR